MNFGATFGKSAPNHQSWINYSQGKISLSKRISELKDFLRATDSNLSDSEVFYDERSSKLAITMHSQTDDINRSVRFDATMCGDIINLMRKYALVAEIKAGDQEISNFSEIFIANQRRDYNAIAFAKSLDRMTELRYSNNSQVCAGELFGVGYRYEEKTVSPQVVSDISDF